MNCSILIPTKTLGINKNRVKINTENNILHKGLLKTIKKSPKRVVKKKTT